MRINETLSVITTFFTLLGHTNKLDSSLSRVCAVTTTLATLLSLQLTFLHHIGLLPRPAPHLQLCLFTLQDHLTTSCVHFNIRSFTEPLAFLPSSAFPPLLSSSSLIYQSSLYSTVCDQNACCRVPGRSPSGAGEGQDKGVTAGPSSALDSSSSESVDGVDLPHKSTMSHPMLPQVTYTVLPT